MPKTTRALAAFALVLAALGEGPMMVAFFSAAFPQIMFVGLQVFFVVLILSMFSFFVSPFPGLVRIGYDLVRRSKDPRRAFLVLNLIYSWAVQLNLYVSYLILIVWFIIGYSLNTWAFFTSFAAGSATVYVYFVMTVIGQGYEDRRGNSFLGAAGMAKLAEVQFGRKTRGGIFNLLTSFEITNTLFNRRRHLPIDLERVYASVEGLSEMKSLPFLELQALAAAMSQLPDRDQLPGALSHFIQTLVWPSGYSLNPRIHRRSNKGLASVAVALLSTIITASFGSGGLSQALLTQYFSIILVLITIAASVYVSLSALADGVPFWILRKVKSLT